MPPSDARFADLEPGSILPSADLVCPPLTAPIFRPGDKVWWRTEPVSLSQPAIVRAIPVPLGGMPAGAAMALASVVQIEFNSACYGERWVETISVAVLVPRDRHIPGLDPEPQVEGEEVSDGQDPE